MSPGEDLPPEAPANGPAPAQPAPAPPPAAAPADGLGFEALLRGAWALVRAHPVPLLLPLVLLGLLNSGSAAPFQPQRDLGAADVLDNPLLFLPLFAAFGVLAIAVLVVLYFLHVAAYLVTTRAALDAHDLRRAPDLGVAFRATKHRIVGAAGTMLLALLVVLAGFVLLIVPGIIALAGLLPLTAVLASEPRGGADALKRAWRLTKGHKGPLAALVLLGILAGMLASLVLGALPFVGAALAGAAEGAVGAFLAVVGALFYARKTRSPAPPAPLVTALDDAPP